MADWWRRWGRAFVAFNALLGPGLAVPTQFLAGRAAAAGVAAMNTITMFSGFVGPDLDGGDERRDRELPGGTAGIDAAESGGGWGDVGADAESGETADRPAYEFVSDRRDLSDRMTRR